MDTKPPDETVLIHTRGSEAVLTINADASLIVYRGERYVRESALQAAEAERDAWKAKFDVEHAHRREANFLRNTLDTAVAQLDHLRARYDFLHANCVNITQGNQGAFYWWGRGYPYAQYSTLDALIDAEMARTKETT